MKTIEVIVTKTFDLDELIRMIEQEINDYLTDSDIDPSDLVAGEYDRIFKTIGEELIKYANISEGK